MTGVGTFAMASWAGRFAREKLIHRIAPPTKATQPRVPIAVATAATTVTTLGPPFPLLAPFDMAPGSLGNRRAEALPVGGLERALLVVVRRPAAVGAQRVRRAPRAGVVGTRFGVLGVEGPAVAVVVVEAHGLDPVAVRDVRVTADDEEVLVVLAGR